jgi:predicted acylesterase/phospholipase RssA
VKGWTPPDANGRRFYPSVFSVLFQMSTVFQKRLSDLILRADPPDVLIRPDFSVDPPCYSNVGCGIEAGEEAARRALPAIRRAISAGEG